MVHWFNYEVLRYILNDRDVANLNFCFSHLFFRSKGGNFNGH